MVTYLGPMFICKNPSVKKITYKKLCPLNENHYYHGANSKFCHLCGTKLKNKRGGSDFKRKLDLKKNLKSIVTDVANNPYDCEKKLFTKELDVHQLSEGKNYFIDLYWPNHNKDYIIDGEKISFKVGSIYNKYDEDLNFAAQEGYGLLSDNVCTYWLYNEFYEEYKLLMKLYGNVKMLDSDDSVIISYGII